LSSRVMHDVETSWSAQTSRSKERRETLEPDRPIIETYL
jgi:hypothetical protein